MTTINTAPAPGTYADPRGRAFRIEGDMIRAGGVNIPSSVLIGRDDANWRLTSVAADTAATTATTAGTGTRAVQAFVDLAIGGSRVVPVRQRDGAWDCWNMAEMEFVRVSNNTDAELFPRQDTYTPNHQAVLRALIERCTTSPVVETMAAPTPPVDIEARRELDRVYEALRTLDENERGEVNSVLASNGLAQVSRGARDVECEFEFTAEVTTMTMVPEQYVGDALLPEQEVQVTRNASFEITLILEGYEGEDDPCESTEATDLVESWLNDQGFESWDDLDFDRRRCSEC